MTHVARFAAAIEGLPDLEREVVTRAAERIARGAHVGLSAYGPLSLQDERDKAEEAAQEAGDGLFYLTWGAVQRERRPLRLDRDTEPCTMESEIDREG